MARFKNSASTAKNTTEKIQIHIQTGKEEDNLPSTNPNPIKIEEEPSTQLETTATGKFFRGLFKILFYSHFLLITILIVFLTVRGFLSNQHHFNPKKWYPPLFASTACAGIAAFTWQAFTHYNPSRTIKAAFWLSPLLTCAAGILLTSIGSPGSLAVAIISLVSALVQSLYACWVSPRFDYATRVLSVSVPFPPAKTTLLIILSIITTTVYTSFLVSGIGGATATGTGFDTLFIIVILFSLAWTMNLIKNIMYVTISRIKYIHFACGMDFDTYLALHDTVINSLGSICIGSVLVPVLGLVRGSARGMSLVAGDTDEFMFSCVNCYSGVASRLVTYGNRWGYVQVGVYNKGFVQASIDTWEMFKRVGLEILIDSDLTGSFCFLCGVAGGSACSLVGGSWALVVQKNYATEISIYAFLIGYFMSRVAMAWPQACVSAYYVAYADNPQSLRFDSTIPDRIQQLQRSLA